MKKLFIVGGMGAGKSSVRRVLESEGVVCLDLDQVGHEVLAWDEVIHQLVKAFGQDILDDASQIQRSVLATKAFASQDQTQKLTAATLPYITKALAAHVQSLEQENIEVVAIEYSAFNGERAPFIDDVDTVIAVVAPVRVRIERAVKHGWEESDVRARIARQITDVQRESVADVVFENVGTPADIEDKVRAWWKNFSQEI